MRVSLHEDRLLLRLVLQVEELANDQLGHLLRRGAGVKARPASALHLSGGVTTGIIDHEAIAMRPGRHRAATKSLSPWVTWAAIGMPRYTMRLLRSSDGMSGGGPSRCPSTMMPPPAAVDCISTPPSLISHDESDAVGTLLRLARRAGRPRTPASYTRANEPGNKPSRRRRRGILGDRAAKRPTPRERSD